MVLWSNAWAADGPGEIVIRDAWIREAPPSATVHAAYGLILNSGTRDVELVAVYAADYGSTMLHQTLQKDGVNTMAHLEKLKIPAGGQVALLPGGIHIMLMQPQRALKAGEKVQLIFCFSDDRRIEVTALVRKSE